MQHEPRIEPRRAPSARPRSAFSTTHLKLATRTLVEVLQRAPLRWNEGGSDHVHRHAGQSGHAYGNPVVTVVRVSSHVAVEVIPHMQEFFGNNHLDREVTLKIYSIHVDEDGVHALVPHETIRPAIG